MMKRRDSGFSLLEIIIVMAIAGGILTMYTRYVRKQADRSAQQTISAALVQEMKGVINFVRDPDVVINSDESDATEEISNPLYNTDKPDADYQVRLSNDVNDIDTGSESEYYLWGDGSDASQQQRYRFTSSSCKVTTPKSNYAFEKEYLPCWMSGAAKNTSAHIDRVGFRGSDMESQQSSINQIDIIVEFGADNRDNLADFARFQPALAQAFSDAGDVPSHAWVVHRESSSADWQLVTKNNDQKTPVEFGSIASSINTLNSYTTGEFGVRFTFDLNDNDSGTTASSGGGDMCWNSADSKVEMCYEQNAGTGTHGENTVLALNMKDANNTNGDQKLGTLQANLVMENTARKVYLFQRSYGGFLMTDSAGNPILYQYKDSHGQLFTGEYYMDDVHKNEQHDSNTYSPLGYYYNSETYDAFELVTPTITDYVSHFRQQGQYVKETSSERAPSYADGISADDWDNDYNNVRYPVQTCPQIEQDIVLRNDDGSLQTGSDGKPKMVKVMRRLFPRLSVAISSISAYPADNQPQYSDPSQNRIEVANKNNYYYTGGIAVVGQLAGITVQTEFAKQDMNMLDAGTNEGLHYLYPESKYIWIISSVLGVYKASDGSGANIVNPWSVSYTISRWCSTIPQPGTPADLIGSTQYQ